MTIFTVIVTLVKHSADVHWNVWANNIVIEEIVCHLFRFLKNY